MIEDPEAPWNKHSCLFLHVPKCGGMSIWSSLFKMVPRNPHIPLYQYAAMLPKAVYANAFKFTFVRNPWDRLVSAYCYFRQGGRDGSDQKWVAEHFETFPSFEEFVLKHLESGAVQNKAHFRTQSSFVTMRGRMNLDFVGKVETLSEDYEALRDRLGFGEPLEQINRSNRESADYRTFYTDVTAEQVARTYADDIIRFGYTFDPAE